MLPYRVEMLHAFKVVHNNCLRGIILIEIMTLKSIVSQIFSVVCRALIGFTDPMRWVNRLLTITMINKPGRADALESRP